MGVWMERYKTSKRIIGAMGLKTVMIVKNLEYPAEFPLRA